MLKKLLIIDEKGVAVIWFAAALVLLLGSSGLVVDLGYLYYQREKLMDIAEASAMAGAMELSVNSEAAIAKAKEYAVLNGVEAGEVTATVTSDSKKVKVKIDRDVSAFFERIFGIESRQVSGFGAAERGGIISMKGLVPFGIVHQELIQGEEYILKMMRGAGEFALPGGEHPGNFYALQLGESGGASVFRDNIKYGYDGVFFVGEWILTEPGVMEGPTVEGVNYRMTGHEDETYDNHPDDSPRIVICPVLREFQVAGRDDVEIVSFAAFWLEGIETIEGSSCVKGRFFQMMVDGEIGSVPEGFDCGLFGIQMADYYEE